MEESIYSPVSVNVRLMGERSWYADVVAVRDGVRTPVLSASACGGMHGCQFDVEHDTEAFGYAERVQRAARALVDAIEVWEETRDDG